MADALSLNPVELRVLEELHAKPLPRRSAQERVLENEALLRYSLDFLPWLDFLRAGEACRSWREVVEGVKRAECTSAEAAVAPMGFCALEARILTQAKLSLQDQPPEPQHRPASGPDVWKECVDEFGHEYSKNRLTGEIIWKKPRGEEEDWEEYVDECGERCYYNRVTGATITARSQETNAYAAEHWSQFVDGDGHLHVYNVITGESTQQRDARVDLTRGHTRRLRDGATRSWNRILAVASAVSSRVNSGKLSSGSLRRSSPTAADARTTSSSSLPRFRPSSRRRFPRVYNRPAADDVPSTCNIA